MLKRFGLMIVGCIALFACVACSTGGDSDDSDAAITFYSITYNANGATSGTVPVDGSSYYYNQATYVRGNPGNLARTGYVFKGWATTATFYFDGMTLYKENDVITVKSNMYLYAVWGTANTVTYSAPDATSGSVPIDSTVYEDGKYVTLKENTGNLQRTGYVFAGWYPFGNGGVYAPGYQYQIWDDVTFYAQWTASGTGSTGGTGGTASHTYADSGNAELALTYGMAAGVGVTSTSATSYTSQSTTSTSLTVVYHLNGYTYGGLTLNGTITSIVSTSPKSTSYKGTVTVSGGSVTKIVYDYGSTGTAGFTGTKKFTFTDGSTWSYNMATYSFTQD